MPEQEDNLSNDQRKSIENMHKTFLEALRHREQEILRFIAILAPALGGFIWLLKEFLENSNGTSVFTVGTVSVLFILMVGAIYALALGYNFRYVTLQLAKMESENCLNIKKFILESWPRTAKKWADKYRKWPYCDPPDIIKVFWLAFVAAKLFIILVACFFLWVEYENVCGQICTIIIVGGLCIIIAVLFAPIYYGWKLHIACDKEEKKGEW